MGSEANSNNFYMDNGTNLLGAMANCNYYPNALPSAVSSSTGSSSNSSTGDNNTTGQTNDNNIANSYHNHGHLNIANNNNINNTNENGQSNTNDNNNNDNNNNRSRQNNRWNETGAPVQQHQHDVNGNNATQNDTINTNGHNNDRAHNAHIATISSPPQSNAILNAFHNSRNPWHFNGIPSCYPRIYNENTLNLSNSNVSAQNHYPYHHHYYHHHLQHTDQNSVKTASYSSHQQQGKASGNSKDICGNDDKFKEDGDPWNVEAQAAFLGPNLWDKTLPYDTDLKVTHYADLDEFLSENNIPDGLPGTHLGHSTGMGHRNDSLGHSTGLALGLGHITTKRERSPSPSDCVSPDTINPPSPAESTFSFASSGRDFDPRTRAFSDEELKPQPMIKKSRKQFVPDELKDDKYWARRRKNNIAAKRSRDARRQKENQIAMRARYLEKENSTLHQELEQLKQENMELRARLSKYQDV